MSSLLFCCETEKRGPEISSIVLRCILPLRKKDGETEGRDAITRYDESASKQYLSR